MQPSIVLTNGTRTTLASLASLAGGGGGSSGVSSKESSSESPASTSGATARYPLGDPRSLVQGTSEWKSARSGLLTASVAGAALGVKGAFRSRDSVAAALHAALNGLTVPGEEDAGLDESRQAAMERGRTLEPVVRRVYERLRGVRVEESGLHLHPRHPKELAASPDGIVLRFDGTLSDLIEFKVPRQNTTGAGLTDAYMVQLQLTMACTNTQRADFVVYVERPGGRSGLLITCVERDDNLLKIMTRQLLAFHAEARLDDQPYPLNSSDLVELRSALRDARAEHVGDETEYHV
jgi:predicted phage-related endonuclease